MKLFAAFAYALVFDAHQLALLVWLLECHDWAEPIPKPCRWLCLELNAQNSYYQTKKIIYFKFESSLRDLRNVFLQNEMQLTSNSV